MDFCISFHRKPKKSSRGRRFSYIKKRISSVTTGRPVSHSLRTLRAGVTNKTGDVIIVYELQSIKHIAFGGMWKLRETPFLPIGKDDLPRLVLCDDQIAFEELRFPVEEQKELAKRIRDWWAIILERN